MARTADRAVHLLCCFASMTLVQQLLRLCTASLALGLCLLAIRGLPRPTAAADATHMCAAAPEIPDGGPAWIEQTDARALLGDPAVVFVDCRPRDQFQSGHISGALSLPSDKELLPSALDVLRGARTIVAYCDARGGCESSQRLAARLRELGLSNVRILKDGLPGWIQNGYPAESGGCRLCVESKP
jgi:rhodanese-related sulfurtransferase